MIVFKFPNDFSNAMIPSDTKSCTRQNFEKPISFLLLLITFNQDFKVCLTILGHYALKG